MKTANTNTASATDTNGKVASNVTALVTKSKIDMAKDLFAEISGDNYTPADGSSPRKDFISRCVSELDMTEKGASTYWQNLRNDAKGEGMYKNGKQPTGEPRGRKPDHNGRLLKAAAKVQRLQTKVDTDLKALQEAQTQLVAMATGDQQAAS